ncbi:MAG: TonB-dependent receptor plug domain-containing protein, partial [bacterium]
MIKYFSTALFLFFTQLAFSQFKGIVIDQTTRQPVADVHVSIINSALGTVTDNAGEFVLNNSAADSLRLRVSAIGYSTVEYVMARDRENSIELIPSAILLNNAVIITAQRSERLSFDVAQSTSTISATQLAELTPRSTPEALMNETGVWVQKTNHGGGSPIIRGLVGNQVLLVVDGIRLNNATYRYGPNQYLSTIDPGLIDRIEVNRGSGSVLYGSDALGGVVHVISATPSF